MNRGIDEFTMRRVADGSGVSAAAIYHHFSDRSALLDEVIAIGFERFQSYLNRARVEVDPVARLHEAGVQYVRFGLDFPNDYRVMFMMAADPDRFPGDLPRMNSLRFLVALLESCAASGGLRLPASPADTALLFWSTAHGLVTLYLVGRLDVDAAAFRTRAAAQLSLLIDAFRVPHQPADEAVCQTPQT